MDRAELFESYEDTEAGERRALVGGGVRAEHGSPEVRERAHHGGEGRVVEGREARAFEEEFLEGAEGEEGREDALWEGLVRIRVRTVYVGGAAGFDEQLVEGVAEDTCSQRGAYALDVCGACVHQQKCESILRACRHCLK